MFVYITVIQGNIMDTTVSTVIEGVDTLLSAVPRGCGEQTMIMLAPIVYALQYLNRTNQLTPQLERKGVKRLKLGML